MKITIIWLVLMIGLMMALMFDPTTSSETLYLQSFNVIISSLTVWLWRKI